MNELEEILKNDAAVAGNVTARRCKLGKLLDAASTETRRLILFHTYSETTSDAKLHHMLEGGGYYIAESGFSKHRNGDCICTHAHRAADEPIATGKATT